MEEFVVYVLYSEKHNSYYTGYTSDLINRFKSHNHLAIHGFTIKYRPWKVIYTEHFADKKEAMKREKELKSGNGRTFIKTKVIPLLISIGFISA